VIEAMKQLYGAQSAKPVKRRRAFEPIAMPAPATRGVAAFKEQI
jgi:hypothetical protein